MNVRDRLGQVWLPIVLFMVVNWIGNGRCLLQWQEVRCGVENLTAMTASNPPFGNPKLIGHHLEQRLAPRATCDHAHLQSIVKSPPETQRVAVISIHPSCWSEMFN